MKHSSVASLAVAILAGMPVLAAAAPPIGVPARVPGNIPPVSVPIQMPPTGPATGTGSSIRTNARADALGRSAQTGLRSSTTATTAVGTVTAFSGTTLTVTLPNRAVKTFTVDAHAAAAMNLRRGAQVAVGLDAKGDVVSFAPANQTLHATVASVAKSNVTLRLPNGRSLTIALAPQAAARMNLTPGANVEVTTHDGFRTAALSRPARKQPARKAPHREGGRR